MIDHKEKAKQNRFGPYQSDPTERLSARAARRKAEKFNTAAEKAFKKEMREREEEQKRIAREAFARERAREKQIEEERDGFLDDLKGL